MRVATAVAWSSGAWVDVHDEADRVVLRICGELDTASHDTISTVVMYAIDSVSQVELDLTELTFCDSRGLAILITASQKAAANGVALTISNARPLLLRLIDTAGLRDTLLNRR